MIRIVIASGRARRTRRGAASAQASPRSSRPAAQGEAVVTGAIVRIGDLVENAGAVADVPIFRAPDLGQTGTVPADARRRSGAPACAGRARHRRTERGGGHARQPRHPGAEIESGSRAPSAQFGSARPRTSR